MKKIILALTIAAFAVSVQAGEGCSKDKAACGAKNQAACAGKDQAACSSKQASACCAKSGDVAKSKCPKAQAAKRWLMSPKAAGELAMAK